MKDDRNYNNDNLECQLNRYDATVEANAPGDGWKRLTVPLGW